MPTIIKIQDPCFTHLMPSYSSSFKGIPGLSLSPRLPLLPSVLFLPSSSLVPLAHPRAASPTTRINELTINASSSSTLSPNLNAKSHTACVQLSTPICSSYVNACIWLVTRAWSTMVRASAVRPDMAHPMCESISMIFSMDDDSIKGDGTRFSTARMTPVGVVMPTVVDPS